MTSEKDKEIARLTRAIKLETDDRLKEKYIKRKAAIENGEIIIKEKDRFENKKYHRPIKNMNVARTIEKPSIIKTGFQKIISFLRSFIFIIIFLAIGGGLKLVYDFLFQPVHLFDWKSSLIQGGLIITVVGFFLAVLSSKVSDHPMSSRGGFEDAND